MKPRIKIPAPPSCLEGTPRLGWCCQGRTPTLPAAGAEEDPMLKSIRILGTAALAAALLAVLPGAVAARPGFSEVVLEGGLAEPLGDLGDDWETVAGFGAETGYELGLRFRARWPSGWALSPSFHYVRMAKHSGFVEGESLSFFGRGSIFAYGVDAQYFLPARRNRPQFYLSLGAALMHNRYREEYSDGDWFEEGVNTLGLAAVVSRRTIHEHGRGMTMCQGGQSTLALSGVQDQLLTAL